MIVVVNVDMVAFPFPIAATIQVVGSNHPIRVVVEHHAPRPEIHVPRDKVSPHMLVSAIGIGMPRADAVMVVVPIAVVRVMRIVPALMLAVVVPVGTIVPMSVVAFVSAVVVLLATITTVIAVLARCGDGQGSCQSHEQCSSNDFAHRSSLQINTLPNSSPKNPFSSL